MGFFSNISSQGKFNKKLTTVSTHRNKILMSEIKSVHPLFTIIPMYLGSFYQGVLTDDKASVFFEILAEATEQQIDFVNRLLTVWFFWSADRLMDIKVLKERSVVVGFSKVWSLSDVELKSLVSSLDASGQGKDILYLWKKIEEVLNHGDINPLYVFPHLRNAMTSVLQGR
ncbi:MAG: hypothetical protein WCV68_00555 [Candidatus Paceibacterota bacterium]|jgi:hypothetical protein